MTLQFDLHTFPLALLPLPFLFTGSLRSASITSFRSQIARCGPSWRGCGNRPSRIILYRVAMLRPIRAATSTPTRTRSSLALMLLGLLILTIIYDWKTRNQGHEKTQLGER